MTYKEDMKEIMIILTQIIQLLESVNENSWVETLKNCRNDCGCVENEEEANDIRRKILSIYGGMGSFNDLVLGSAGNILPENKELDRLSTKLFETLRNQL